MTPEESLIIGLTEHQNRLIVINQQIAVLVGERFRVEQRMHHLIDARVGYEKRSYLLGIECPSE